MSTSGEDGSGKPAAGRRQIADGGPSIRDAGPLPSAHKARYAAAAFVTLLLLSVFWPSPVVSSNELWLHQQLSVDELSFLGREAPSWDVIFWCLAGLLLLAILQSADSFEWREAWQQLRAVRVRLTPRTWIVLGGGAIAVALVWLLADARVIAWAEGVQSDATEDVIRIFNRLGGGMNPALVVLFFLVAGIAYRRRNWVSCAVAMALAGLVGGILAQIAKLLVGRARPELWLGPFQHAPGSSTSFPSGHTVGAFALAGVLLFASRSLPLRVLAIALAAAVGLSRILAFRHWPSDVTASAVLGLVAASVCVAGVIRVTRASASPS